MSIELVPLTSSDSEIPELIRMHHTPSVARYISISDNYFNYVTGTERVVYYKIFSNGILYGGIHCEFYGEMMYLSVCIKEEYQRQGYASSALRQLFSALPSQVRTIEVNIDETNVSSRQLFEKLGFEKVDRDEDLITYRMRCLTGTGFLPSL